MKITLTQEQVELIQKQIHSGQFETVNQTIEAALRLLDQQNKYDHWIEDIRQKIDVAAMQLDHGEGTDGEDAITQLRVKLRQGKKA